MGLSEDKKLFQNGSGGKEMPPFPAAPELAEMLGPGAAGVWIWMLLAWLAHDPC